MSRICLFCLGVFIILCSLYLLFIPNTPAFAHTEFALDTPTPDASSILSQAQTLNNVVVTGLTVVGIVLGALALASAILAFVGFTSVKEFDKLKTEMREDLEDMRNTRGALVYISIGDRLMAIQSVSDALANYKIASSLSPKDPEINYLLGRIYSGAGYYDDAISALTIAAQQKSHYPKGWREGPSWRELGLAYRRRGIEMSDDNDIDEAIACLKKAIVLDAQDDDTYAIIGGLYRRKREYKQAIAHYKKAYTINPGSSYATGNIASLLWHEGQVPEAKKYFETTEMLAQDLIKSGKTEGYWNYYDLALAHLMLGRSDAVQCYEKAVEETPSPKVETFRGVLDNLDMIKDSAVTITNPVAHLAKVLGLLEDAKNN